MIAHNDMHDNVQQDSVLNKALQVSERHALNLDGSFAQMDASLGDAQLNPSSAPAPLTAKDNASIDYKMVDRRVHKWDGSLNNMIKFFTQFEEVAGAHGLLPFLLGLVSIIIPITCTAQQPSATVPPRQGKRPDPLLESHQQQQAPDTGAKGGNDNTTTSARWSTSWTSTLADCNYVARLHIHNLIY